MDTKKVQLLRNPDIQPTADVIENALGTANTAFRSFTDALDSHSIQLEWRYYTDGKAWLAKGLYRWTGVRGGKKEATVFWLSVWDGFFRVTVYLPEEHRADISNLQVDETVKTMAKNVKQMGKMKTFPLVFNLSSDELYESVFAVVDFKKLAVNIKTSTSDLAESL